MRVQSPFLSSRPGMDSEYSHSGGPDRGITATVCGFRRGGIAMGRMQYMRPV